MTSFIADFEGTVASNSFLPQVPPSYHNFFWQGIGAGGKKFVQSTFDANNGYNTVLHNKAVGFVQPAEKGGDIDSTISPSVGKGNTFTIKSGTFAAAWNNDETVTFHAMHFANEVGTKTVTLDRDATTIHFGSHFKHITALVITSSGGTDADAGDGGQGNYLAMDDLKMVLDDGMRHAGSSHVDAGSALADHVASTIHLAPHLADCLY